jgi:hypothetical protein
VENCTITKLINKTNNMEQNITLIDQKFPEVEYVQGEDLNIENMKQRIITRAWYDTARFHDLNDIAVGIGMGTRTLYFYAKKLKLPKRSELK